MQEYIDLKIDFKNRNADMDGITLKDVVVRNYDSAIRFRIEIIGHLLDETYDIKVLSSYQSSDLKIMNTLGNSLEIVDGKLIYAPKVEMITEAEYVKNYLYISKDELGLDIAQFNYDVGLSKISEVTVNTKQVYDESYESMITEFEQALEDYKLTLPQFSDIKADIDLMLNQFSVDSQNKLDHFDESVQ